MGGEVALELAPVLAALLATTLTPSALALIIAVGLDLAIGDPVYGAHPVRLIGRSLQRIESWLRSLNADGYGGGILLFVALAVIWVGGLSSLVVGIARQSVGQSFSFAWLGLAAGWLLHVFLLYSLLALGDLLKHGWRIERALGQDDLAAARTAVSQLVGRDTAPMDAAACRRAAVESLSENLTDGFTSPLFWYLVFGLPGVVLFKVVSTMDSMVGYKTERYLRFGWCGARLDDLMNFVPARLTWLLLAGVAAVLPRCSGVKALRIGWRQHAVLPGPNSGWSEAATAGAIQRRLVGPIWMNEQLVTSIWIGDASDPPMATAEDYSLASLLISTSGVVATLVAAVALALLTPVSVLAQEAAPSAQAPPTFEDETTVSATRTGGRLEDQPMRVEVLEREEIEEKLMMTPGDIVMMLNEMGGMRVQATSPGLGAASVRIQGMRGRYTRFLSDGLPLFGEQVGALGLLQIPPMDLGRVEVIKGVASSLYGAGAMGGVVNLIARRPGREAEREVLFNQSTRGATDLVAWLGAPLSQSWGASLLVGGHRQQRTDVDDDAWADLPGYARGVIRPRVFWDGGGGKTFFMTSGLTVEERAGGTMPGRTLPATGAPYAESIDTLRFDAGAVGQTLVSQRFVVSIRAAAAQQRHGHRFGEVGERDRHGTAFAELAVRAASGRHTGVIGAAVEYDTYRPTDLPQFAYTYTVPGLFAQDDVQLAPWASLSASARLDRHSEYGVFFSPRLALLLRSGEWNSRLSAGTGFFGPSALTEETEATGLSRLTIALPLRAERGRSASFDLTRTAGPVSSTITLFTSRIANPLHLTRTDGLELGNRDAPTINGGVELLSTVRYAPFALTGSYTYVRAREDDGAGERDIALTPRHSSGVVAMWEREGVGRIGVEWYFTGRQQLDDNPHRDQSEPYSIFGVLAERQFGRFRLFVNGENLSSVRQSRWDPLVRSSRAADGRWTVDAWAPLDGRTINGGMRVTF